MQKNNSKKRNKRKTTVILIVLMLCMIAAACAWLYNYGVKSSEMKKEAELEELINSPEDTITEAAEMDEAVAENRQSTEHIIYQPAADAEVSLDMYDKAVSAGVQYIGINAELSQDSDLAVSNTGGALKLSEVFDKYGKSVTYVINPVSYETAGTYDAFQKLVDEYGYEDAVMAQSNDIHVLSYLESIYPDMKKLYLCRSQWGFDTSQQTNYIDVVSVQDWLMTEENCRIIHERGLEFGAWTLDTDEKVRRAINMGAESYFTTEPEMAIKQEKEYRTGE